MAISKCDADFQPISRAAPRLPSKLHNEFEGHAVVQFVVSADGHVYEPSIASSDWSSVGSARGEPEGYEEAILAAITKWRYPPRTEACRATSRIEFTFEF